MEPAYATLLSRLRALGIRPENRSETELATIWDAYLEGLVQHDHHNVLTPEERAYDERHAQLEELQSASITRARAEDSCRTGERSHQMGDLRSLRQQCNVVRDLTECFDNQLMDIRHEAAEWRDEEQTIRVHRHVHRAASETMSILEYRSEKTKIRSAQNA